MADVLFASALQADADFTMDFRDVLFASQVLIDVDLVTDLSASRFQFSFEADADFTTLFTTALDRISLDVISHYPLDEGNGLDRLDRIDSNTLVNVNVGAAVSGKIGNATRFVRASNMHLNVGAFNFDGTSSFTFTCWHDPLSVVPAFDNFVVARWLSPTDRQYLLMVDDPGDNYTWLISSNGSAFVQITPTFTVTAGFHLLIAEYNHVSNVMKLRIDEGGGSKEASATGPTAINQSADPFRVGKVGSSTDEADAIVDELTVFNRILTDEEKDAIWSAGAGVDLLPLFFVEFAF